MHPSARDEDKTAMTAGGSKGRNSKPRLLRDGLALFRDRRGSAITIFALALPSVLALLGGALDYAAVMRDQSRLQSAADAAALAVAREMSMGPMSPDRVQMLAATYVAAQFTDPPRVAGTIIEKGMGVQVRIQKPAEAPLGILPMLGAFSDLSASAVARVNADSMPIKLCLLSLGDKGNGGIYMHNNAVITAPQCMLQSNSTVREAIIIRQGSKLQSNLTCARGGIANDAGILQTILLTDCPPVANPLEQKPEPPASGPCLANKLEIRGTEKRTLAPGIYCNGVTIEGSAQVTLAPGIFVFRGGPLIARQSSELLGNGVTLMFSGRKSYFRFLDNSLIRLSAPASGISAGMLLWESRTFQKGHNSWQNGGCGNKLGDDDDDRGTFGCSLRGGAGLVPPRKNNEHHINSERARELTGTIYLRNGLLLVDSRRPIADQSPFTIIVVGRLDLYDGPNLVLNANYGDTTVPVPPGLGPIGAKSVRLGN
ncbi:MAG: pilus assembly protein [Methylobacterium sp.]|nr:pilus assembly protein [Methylobacterium sp.]